jgi:hypothetical protein
MCYSAQVEADYKKYVKMFGAHMDIAEFTRLYFERAEGRLKARFPKAMDDAFVSPQSDAEGEIKQLIARYNTEQSKALEEELFKQRGRLVAAERTLQTKTTKAATESKRIAADKIEAALSRIDDIRRTEPLARDSRIFPGNYAPVLIQENGQLVVRPMRYLCRIAGKAARANHWWRQHVLVGTPEANLPADEVRTIEAVASNDDPDSARAAKEVRCN